MKTNDIQALLSLNASKIASKHAMHDSCVQEARKERFRGNVSLMIEEFKKAASYRTQLAKLHERQNRLYAELKHRYCMARIQVKVRKLCGVEFEKLPVGVTGFEFEAQLDWAIAEAAKIPA